MIKNQLLTEMDQQIGAGNTRTAIVCEDKTYSYELLYMNIEKRKMQLQEAGLREKNRVIVKVKNQIDFIEVLLAIWRLGAIPIPMSAVAEPREIENAIHEGRAHFIVSEELEQEFYKDAASVGEHLSLYQTKCSEKSEDELCDAMIYFYTTGTTGNPKCVEFSSEAFYYNIADLAESIHLTDKDTMYTPIAPYLTAALTTVILPILLVGGTLVLSSKQLPRAIFRTIKEQRVTVFFAVPYVYTLLVESHISLEEWEKTTLRLCLSSSAHLPKSTIQEFYEQTKKYIRAIYCSSEAGVITYNDSDKVEEILNSVGRCMKNVNISLLGESGQSEGEIFVQSNHLSSGYFGKEELQKEVYCADGVKTGDIARINENGYIFLLGRESSTINVAGHLVHPEEVEDVLLEMEHIKEAFVYGSENATTGEFVAAKIVTDGKKYDIEDIISFCKMRLSNYKIPRSIVHVESIDKGNYGKKRRK